MNTGFKDVMSKRTDEELIKIVTVGRNDYQPLALEAAEEEIKNRNIDATRIEKVKTDLTIKIEEQKQLDEKKVSSLTRFFHLIIDTVAFLALTYLISYILGLLTDTDNQALMTEFGYLSLVISFFGYHIFMETKYQKTIGKFITKTRVVAKNGGKPRVGDIVRRTFCRLIPFDRVSFLFTQNGFHDRFSDTTIIKDEE